MFGRKLTKWMLLGNYSFGEKDYIVFVRGNLKTGLMDFKIKSVHGHRQFTRRVLPDNIIDVREQWGEIKNLMK